MKKLILKLGKKLRIVNGEKITKSERYAIMTALSLMKTRDSELTLHPKKDKYYIKSKNDKIWIKIDNYPANVTIVNHRFRYDIKFSNRAMDILRNRFIDVTESRRDEIEKSFLDNTENSLRAVYNSIPNL